MITALAIAVAQNAAAPQGEAFQWLAYLERAGTPALALFSFVLAFVSIYLWKSRENWIQFAFKQQAEFQVALDKIRLEQIGDSKKALDVLERSSAAGLEMAQLLNGGGSRRRRR